MRNACYKEGFFFFFFFWVKHLLLLLGRPAHYSVHSSTFTFVLAASTTNNKTYRREQGGMCEFLVELCCLHYFVSVLLCDHAFMLLYGIPLWPSVFWSFLRGNFDDACSIIEHAVSTHKEYVLDCSCSVPHDSAKQWDDWESEVKHLCWKHAKVQASSVTLRMLLTLLISFSRAFVRHWKDGIDIYEKSCQQYTLHKM